jgi:hypothetical protein
MSEWKKEFKRHLIDVLVKEGGKIDDKASAFSWQEYDFHGKYKSMISNHGIDYDKTTYTESSWYEFMGTFYEGDTSVYGVDMNLVLGNGTVLKWRYAGTVSDLTQAVLFEQ